MLSSIDKTKILVIEDPFPGNNKSKQDLTNRITATGTLDGRGREMRLKLKWDGNLENRVEQNPCVSDY